MSFNPYLAFVNAETVKNVTRETLKELKSLHESDWRKLDGEEAKEFWNRVVEISNVSLSDCKDTKAANEFVIHFVLKTDEEWWSDDISRDQWDNNLDMLCWKNGFIGEFMVMAFVHM